MISQEGGAGCELKEEEEEEECVQYMTGVCVCVCVFASTHLSKSRLPLGNSDQSPGEGKRRKRLLSQMIFLAMKHNQSNE